MLRIVSPKEAAETDREVAKLYAGNLENKIQAILMDTRVGSTGMYPESAKEKAGAIVKLFHDSPPDWPESDG